MPWGPRTTAWASSRKPLPRWSIARISASVGRRLTPRSWRWLISGWDTRRKPPNCWCNCADSIPPLANCGNCCAKWNPWWWGAESTFFYCGTPPGMKRFGHFSLHHDEGSYVEMWTRAYIPNIERRTDVNHTQIGYRWAMRRDDVPGCGMGFDLAPKRTGRQPARDHRHDPQHGCGHGSELHSGSDRPSVPSGWHGRNAGGSQGQRHSGASLSLSRKSGV